MNKKNIIKHSIACFIIISFIVIFSLIGAFGTNFLRDFSATYAGGYRIYLGQVPYKDFFIPVGPIVFYIQALFNHIFGPNLIAMAMHVAFLSSILAIIFYFIIVKYFGNIFSIFMSIALYYSYYGVIALPWYNEMALFFFLLNILILIKYLDIDKARTKILVLSAILSALAFYSKQDTGLMQFGLLFLYFVYYYRRDFKKVLVYYVLPFLVLTSLIFIIFSSFSDFEHQFSLGQGGELEQYPHSSIVYQIFSLYGLSVTLYSFNFYLLIFLLFLFFKEDNIKNKKIISILIIINSLFVITSISSGMRNQIRIMALPIILFLFYLLIKNKSVNGFDINKSFFINKKMLTYIIIFFIILMQFNYLEPFTFTRYSYFTTPIGQMYNILYSHNKIDQGCYKGSSFFNTDIHAKDLKVIRNIIEKNNISFISLSEYNFLYCDYNVEPPKGLPLWFHEGSNLFDKDIPIIEKYITENKPSVVLEEIYAAKDSNNKKIIIDTLLKLGYKKVYVAPAPSSDQLEITVYELK